MQAYPDLCAAGTVVDTRPISEEELIATGRLVRDQAALDGALKRIASLPGKVSTPSAPRLRMDQQQEPVWQTVAEDVPLSHEVMEGVSTSEAAPAGATGAAARLARAGFAVPP